MDEYPDNIREIIDSEDVVQNCIYEDANNYSLTIRTKKKCDDRELSNSEWCNSWINKYSAITKTNWIVRYTFPNPRKYEYKKVFKCHHGSFNKVHCNKRSESRVRNRSCGATISFLLKKINKNTIKNDHLLKERLNIVISIEHKHSHQIQVAEAFSYLRLTNETKQLFWTYFNEGMTPSCAKSYHELTLINQNENEENVINAISNTQINPNERQIYNLHDEWRKTNFGGRDNQSILTIIKQKSKTYEDLGIKVYVNEEPLIIVILTPIMIRAHEREFTGEMIFIDSSGSCDQMNSCVTFVFAAHKIESIPLACIIHTEQSEANYTMIFSLLQKNLGNEGFGKKGFPAVIMTDDSSAGRNALRTVFPNSVLLLCTFHFCQAFWRWLWDGNHKIEKNDRPEIMKCFQKILYSNTTEEFEYEYHSFTENDIIEKYENLKKHINDLYKRKHEWAHAFRTAIITRGNNYCEASIRIFKDLVLQRCKAFNARALLDFVCKVFECYHKKRLLSFANYRKNKYDLIYSKLKHRAKDLLVKKISESQYLVTSGSDNQLLYTVTVHIYFGMCDCPSGQGGKFCKHICAVEETFHVLSYYNIPKLSSDDRKDLAKLAMGKNIDTRFFDNMMETSFINNEITSFSQDNTSLNLQIDEVPSNAIPLQTSSLTDTQSIDVKREIAMQTLSENLLNIVQIMKNKNTPESTNMNIRLNKSLERIKTPAEVMNLFAKMKNIRRPKTIRVQPTSISRRTKRPGLTSGSRRVQAGRPAKNEVTVRKRKHVRSLTDAVSANRNNAKSH